jgi:ATP-dependent Clp protease adaptor protein ClpS
MATETITRPDLAGGSETQTESWIVVVYNNEQNTYDEVMMILMIATHCNEEEAFIETWEVDHLGKSVVHNAGKEECEDVAQIIRQIGIKVEVIAE